MTPEQKMAEAIGDMQRSAAEYAVKLMDVQYGTRMDAMNVSIRNLEKRVGNIEEDIAGLKTDVAGLKGSVQNIQEVLIRIERNQNGHQP